MRRYIINNDKTILDALKKLDEVSMKENLATLFVQDALHHIIGTITDGDCRRALITGSELTTSIDKVMNRSFYYLNENEYQIDKITAIKKNLIENVPVLNENKELIGVIDFSKGKSFVPVDAVLMAGGLGKRLLPLTENTPKPLLKVDGKAIIDYNIDNLNKFGIDNINVTVNYLKKQIEDHFKNNKTVTCISEPNFLGTIGSLKYIKYFKNDTILLMNSDLFTNLDIESFYLHFLKHNADMSVAAVPYEVNIPYGILDIDNTREISGMKEKPTFHYYANAGAYLLKRELIEEIPNDTFFDATDLIAKLIETDKKVIRFPVSGYWIDIGKPEDFKMVQEFARNINGNN
jgi:dTDP-glucose pyrophosphorylase